MANVITFLGNRILPREVTKRFSVQLSGNYTNSGGGGNVGTPGEILAFNNALNPSKFSRSKIPAGPPAARLAPNANCEVAQIPNGYSAQVEQNAIAPGPNNYVLRVFAGGSGNANPIELATGAYPAGLTGTPLVIEVTVPNKYL